MTSAQHTLQLVQNYPNPFNKVTRINFSIAVADRVVITVHDLLGRNVAMLLDASLDAGGHQMDFSPDNLSSGVYFLRMNAGGRMQWRPMVYLK